MRLRPSYRKGLAEWEDPGAIVMFGDYTAKRQAEGTDIRSFAGLAD
ncbi:hypothetical protein KUH32_16960 [Thalassococcus sp. CAU 1522]|uniref:Uncharacterized protein n=1 Tax=Thalassococcus arenae TaxID=2851652 RepID=A0ABS6NCP6_9RHOB|nr:hypothetical protein [Thalassococcus arenae]MBV2361457.1 hypothetical protein [Thalassococcus arenae]